MLHLVCKFKHITWSRSLLSVLALWHHFKGSQANTCGYRLTSAPPFLIYSPRTTAFYKAGNNITPGGIILQAPSPMRCTHHTFNRQRSHSLINTLDETKSSLAEVMKVERSRQLPPCTTSTGKDDCSECKNYFARGRSVWSPPETKDWYDMFVKLW